MDNTQDKTEEATDAINVRRLPLQHRRRHRSFRRNAATLIAHALAGMSPLILDIWASVS